jgi:hypothetical protein
MPGAHWSVRLMSRLCDQGKGALALGFGQGSGERRAHEQPDKADIDVQEWENRKPQLCRDLSKREAHTFFLAQTTMSVYSIVCLLGTTNSSWSCS